MIGFNCIQRGSGTLPFNLYEVVGMYLLKVTRFCTSKK